MMPVTAELVHIGRGNYVDISRVIGLADAQENDFDERIRDSRERGTLLDFSCDRQVRSIIFTDCGQIVLSSVRAETLVERIDRKTRIREIASSMNPFNA